MTRVLHAHTSYLTQTETFLQIPSAYFVMKILHSTWKAKSCLHKKEPIFVSDLLNKALISSQMTPLCISKTSIAYFRSVLKWYTFLPFRNLFSSNIFVMRILSTKLRKKFKLESTKRSRRKITWKRDDWMRKKNWKQFFSLLGQDDLF